MTTGLPDQPFFLVVVDHATGPYIPETSLTRAAEAVVRADLLDGQYSHVLRVLECRWKDVTDAFETAPLPD